MPRFTLRAERVPMGKHRDVNLTTIDASPREAARRASRMITESGGQVKAVQVYVGDKPMPGSELMTCRYSFVTKSPRARAKHGAVSRKIFAKCDIGLAFKQILKSRKNTRKGPVR